MSKQFPKELQKKMVARYQNGESARKIAESLIDRDIIGFKDGKYCLK